MHHFAPLHLVLSIIICSLAFIVNAESLDLEPFTVERENFTEYTLEGLKRAVNSQPLNRRERLNIIEATSRVLAEYNPNVFLQINFLNQDAFTQIQSLKNRIDGMTNFDFHRAVIQVFSALDDFHTVYLPPQPLRSASAVSVKPFEIYYKEGSKRPTYFVPNTSITLLNVDGVNVRNQVRRFGAASFGANKAAQLREGLLALTSRRLAVAPLPRRDFVRFRITNGQETRTVEAKWRYYAMTREASRDFNRRSEVASVAVKTGRRPELHYTMFAPLQCQNTKWFPDVTAVQPAKKAMSSDTMHLRRDVEVNENLTEVLTAQIVETSTGPIGYIKLISFLPRFSDLELTVTEFARLLTDELPKNRVVIDIRGNGGGFLVLVKFLYEVLVTEGSFPLVPMIRRASETTMAMYTETGLGESARYTANLFRAAVRDGVRFGEQFSGPVSYIFGEPGVFDGEINIPRLKAVYNGTFAVLMSANSFSASDLFSAIVRDQERGVLVGVDASTGGGGATVIGYERSLRSTFNTTFGPKIRGGTDFVTADLRIFRNGRRGGALIENTGVKPDVRYFPTKDDVEKGDVDLFEFLGNLLRDRTRKLNSR